MKPILIHTHFHRRKTGVTRSIENVLPFFGNEFDSYVYGYNIDGKIITKSLLKSHLFSDRSVVVHCHRNNEILRMLWYRFLGAKFKLIATRHAESTPSNLTKFLLKKADRVVTLISSMSENLGITDTMIGHGVRVNDFVPAANIKIDGVTQENIILNPGRVRKAKGQLILLEAAKVLKEHKDWALVIVGKVDRPEFLKELKDLAEKHQIENQVYFFGETSDIISFYQASKIVVAPSYSEGFSLVTAEAMSCACTIIATKNVGVHSDLIQHTKNGYLFEAGNSSELSRMLSELIMEKSPLLGDEAREEIIKNWSAKKEALELIKLYKSN